MSLINQMLQDLDARRAEQGADRRLPNDVRPLPQAVPSRWPLFVLSGLLALTVAGGAWFMLTTDMPLPGVLSTSAPVVVSQPAPAPGTPAAAVEAAPAVEPPPMAPVAPVAQPEAPAASRESEASLRMAEAMQPRAEKSPRKQPEDNTKSVKSVKSVEGEVKPVGEPAKVKPEDEKPAKVVSAPVAKAQKSGTIERTDAAATVRERAEADYRKAIASVNNGRLDEANETLRSALKHDPYHVVSRQLLVRLLLETRRTEEAMQVLQDGLNTQPAQIGWAMSLARMQVDRGNLAGAWQTLEHSLPAASANADYHGFCGNVLQRLGRGKEAVDRYLAATRLASGDGRWWLGLGMAYDAEGRVNEAREAFLRAKSSGTLSPELTTVVDQKLR